jgi:folate-binding protein YgfZ
MPTPDPPTPASAEPATTALRLTGRDVLPLLHRIGTQALLDLAPGGARATLFCDFRGRLLHRAVVAVTADGAVWLLRHDAPGAALAAFVDRHVFRDDVKIEDHSAVLWVAGAEGAQRPAATLERGAIPERVEAGDGVALIVRAGARPSRAPAAQAERERRRILAGRAAHGHEIAEAFHPFEVGLAADVHLDKGCYTGQEALQRLVTYRSVRRGLALVGGRGAPPPPPAEVESAGERIGVLTSAVAGGEPGAWIGLAVLKREIVEAGAPLTIGSVPVTEAARLFPASVPLGLRRGGS